MAASTLSVASRATPAGTTAALPKTSISRYAGIRPSFMPISRAVWHKRCSGNCLVAEASGNLVGLAHFIFHRSTTMLGPTCYLQDLFTNQAARGRGVGRALISAVYERARSAGCTRVYWQTHESNTIAQRLYDTVAERSGFIVYRKDL